MTKGDDWVWVWGDGGSLVLAAQCCRAAAPEEGRFVAFAERHRHSREVRFRALDEAGFDPRPVAFCPYCGARLRAASQIASW